jgi:heterodisulfide reductase subunit C
MINDPDKWGFRPEKSVIIDLDKGNRSLYRKLTAKIPGLQGCLFCGGCHSTCTVQADGMNFRRLHLFLQRGEIHTLGTLIAPCLLCGKCTLVCPRNVDTRSVIYNLRKLLHEPL